MSQCTSVQWVTKDYLLLLSAIARVTSAPNHPDKGHASAPLSIDLLQTIPWTTIQQLIASCPLASPHLQHASITKLQWYCQQFIQLQPFGPGLSLRDTLQVLYSKRLKELFVAIQDEDNRIREQLRQLQPPSSSVVERSTLSPNASSLQLPHLQTYPVSPTSAPGPLSPQAISLGSPRMSSCAAIMGSANPTPVPTISNHTNIPPSTDSLMSIDLHSTVTEAMERDSPSVHLPHRPHSFSSRIGDTSGIRSASSTPRQSPKVFHTTSLTSNSTTSIITSTTSNNLSNPSSHPSPSVASLMFGNTVIDSNFDTPRRPKSPPTLILTKSTIGSSLDNSDNSHILNPFDATTSRSNSSVLPLLKSPIINKNKTEQQPERNVTEDSLLLNTSELSTNTSISVDSTTMSEDLQLNIKGNTEPIIEPVSMPEQETESTLVGVLSPISKNQQELDIPRTPQSEDGPSTDRSSSLPPSSTSNNGNTNNNGRRRRISLKHLDDRHRQWRKSCLRKWDDIADTRLGHTFMVAIKAGETRHKYRQMIHQPMDLKLIKARLREGRTINTDQFHRDLLLMLANARMYYGNVGEWKSMVTEMKTEIDRQVVEFRMMERMAAARAYATTQSNNNNNITTNGNTNETTSLVTDKDIKIKPDFG